MTTTTDFVLEGLQKKYNAPFKEGRQHPNSISSERLGEACRIFDDVAGGRADLEGAIHFAHEVIANPETGDVAFWQEVLADLESLKTSGFPLQAWERRLALQEGNAAVQQVPHMEQELQVLNSSAPQSQKDGALQRLIEYARNHHMVVVEPSSDQSNYSLMQVDVSPVLHDLSWRAAIAELLSGIGVVFNNELEGKEFVFFRLKDPTGVSTQLIGGGPWIVVAGLQLDNGYLAFVWFGSSVPSLTIHKSIANAMRAHGHGLDTQFVYV